MTIGTVQTLYTSLNEIKSFNPCSSGWKTILSARGGVSANYGALFPLIECVDSNSFSEVCWLLGKRKMEIAICVKVAKLCANSVKHINNRFAVGAANSAANAADAAAYAADAAAYTAANVYAAAASNASNAANAAYAAANADADAAAAAAAAAADADADADAAYTAKQTQLALNKQFLRDAIIMFEKGEL